MSSHDWPNAPEGLSAAGDTHLGNREHNEDAVLLRPELGLFVVADGAGGHNAGNVASAMATSSVAHGVERGLAQGDVRSLDELGIPYAARVLARAVHEANREILALSRGSEHHQGMGTTILAALFVPDLVTAYVAHVGDSRCYRLRDQHLELLTRDHTMVNDVLELRPDIDPAAAMRLPRNVVTRALGMTESLRVSMGTFRLAEGDRYLLCSDGLTDVVDDEAIADVLARGDDLEKQVDLLLQASIAAGASDNIAAVIVDCHWLPPLPSKRSRSEAGATLSPGQRVGRDRRLGVDGVRGDVATPEIAVIVSDSIPPAAPLIHVVPSGKVDAGLADAMQDFIAPDPQYGMAFRETTTCPHCSKRIEASSLWCPNCGEAVSS